MDGALGLHHDADAVVGHVEQVVGLDDLEALVHERGGIDRDLRTHVPGRMREGLLERDVGELAGRLAAERAARRRDPQRADLFGTFAQKALVDGAVLGIDGHEGARMPGLLVQRAGERHDEVAGDDEAFLVRKRELRAVAQRLVRSAHAGRADERVHDAIDLVERDEVDEGIRPERYLDPFRQCVEGRRSRERLVPERDAAHAEFRGLRRDGIDAAIRRERDDLELVGMASDDIGRLRSDGARGPQDRDALLTGHRECTLLRTAGTRRRTKPRSWNRRGPSCRRARA